jgi:DNA modification methylase
VKVLDQAQGNNWIIYNGDSCEILKEIPSNSLHYSIFSPPFSSLYTYSNSDRDLGNSKKDDEFQVHFSFMVNELYRVIMPGRLLSFHCMDIPAMKERDGYIGLKDFPGELLRSFQAAGFIYHSRVVIWKDPLVEATRTKALGLMHKQIVKDSAICRNGLPDYLITVRKPGENPEPIAHPEGFTEFIGENEPNARKGDPVMKDSFKHRKISMCQSDPVYSHHVWRRYASPVWMDINQSNTLQRESAREEEDEKHICLATGTLVLTNKGYMPIEDVEIGDSVLTHLGNWKPVIAKKMTKANADIVKVNAVGVPNLRLTPSHKMWARKSYGVKKKENLHRTTAGWIEAQNCDRKTYVNQKLPPEIPTTISTQEWWIIGRWIADGHIDTRGHQFFISVGADKIKEFEKKATGHIGSKNKTGENCYQYGIKKLSKEAMGVLFKCGKGAENKNLPIEIISLCSELAQSFIDGYLSGDGHIRNGKIYVSSVSRRLLLGMSLVFQRIGKCASVYAGRPARKKTINDRMVNCKQEWNLCVSPHYSFGIQLDDGLWRPIKSVDCAGQSDVYSIQVADDASYTAEGCIVKNCPLQLDVIGRALELWTNPNDNVLSPFAGIGSEGFQAVKMGRRFVGIELKQSYYEQAVKNLQRAELEKEQPTLFDMEAI